MLKSGLYEQVINKQIASELESSDKIKKILPIDSAESSKVLTNYLSEIIEKGLDYVKDNHDINKQVGLVNKLVDIIKDEIREVDFDSLSVDEKAQQLLALIDKKNSIYSINENAEVIRPETSLAISSLFTGAVNEPSMFSELKKEIASCDKIDILVSFIKWSGLRLIINELKNFTLKGGKLRIITTSYMGATDIKAIDELNSLVNTEIKVSYDTKRTRLHAKTYVIGKQVLQLHMLVHLIYQMLQYQADLNGMLK